MQLRFSTLFLVLIFASCSNNQEVDTTGQNDTQTATSAAETGSPTSTENIRYPWVNPLNLRDTPSTKGKVITSVTAGTPLTLTGETSEEVDFIVLRGVTYEEFWLQVTTPDQQTGWAFGGALRQKDEQKGNETIDELQFDFPHFGQFDLSTWEAQPVKDESGGDATVKTYPYQKEDQTLEIIRIYVGEYGYSQKFKLMDASGKVLKSRQLDFQIDPLLLTETVSDYSSLPTQTFHRQQRMKKHFLQLNAYPLMVNGEWKKAEPKLPNIQ